MMTRIKSMQCLVLFNQDPHRLLMQPQSSLPLLKLNLRWNLKPFFFSCFSSDFPSIRLSALLATCTLFRLFFIDLTNLQNLPFFLVVSRVRSDRSSSTSTLNSDDMSPRSSTLWLSISLGWGTTSLLLDVSGLGSSGGGGASGSMH